MSPRRVARLLAVAVALLLPAAARAQTAVGIPLSPEQNFFLLGGYDVGMTDDFSSFSGRLGVRLGDESHHLVAGAFTRGRVNQNGSLSYTYSLRYAYEFFDDDEGLGTSACFVLSASRGYSWTFNVEGEHLNGRLTATHLPVAFGLAHAVEWMGVKWAPWILPQFTLVSRDLELYDRQNSYEASGSDYYFAVSAGASATVAEHFFVGLELYTKLSDLSALSSAVSVGALF